MDAQSGFDRGKFEATSTLFVRFLWQFLGTFGGVGAYIVLLRDPLSMGCAARCHKGMFGLQGCLGQMVCVMNARIEGLTAELCTHRGEQCFSLQVSVVLMLLIWYIHTLYLWGTNRTSRVFHTSLFPSEFLSPPWVTLRRSSFQQPKRAISVTAWTDGLTEISEERQCWWWGAHQKDEGDRRSQMFPDGLYRPKRWGFSWALPSTCQLARFRSFLKLHFPPINTIYRLDPNMLFVMANYQRSPTTKHQSGSGGPFPKFPSLQVSLSLQSVQQQYP